MAFAIVPTPLEEELLTLMLGLYPHGRHLFPLAELASVLNRPQQEVAAALEHLERAGALSRARDFHSSTVFWTVLGQEARAQALVGAEVPWPPAGPRTRPSALAERLPAPA